MRFEEFKTQANLVAFRQSSESIIFLCDLTGVSVNDDDFEELLAWFDTAEIK